MIENKHYIIIDYKDITEKCTWIKWNFSSKS